ncbi:DUF3291 domain-containing protein [Noviherbaspirillum cavernae]|uniref:DUF3291 domain-containing protein n=1 Tax=Noviherbaspirillum cavernae TaxID=2320862 RepID=A0A418WX89_9BURK|nr:DUF3291 domain-containing protein [Noviherbaspirillum cavernae]RJG04858.1 DUF3291 domain-containing protein [Noviherbaspirillum cavernae]
MHDKKHLAQVNIGRARGAMDDPVMAGFVAQLDRINALAEASPGFVWRLKTEEGNATSLQPYADERIIVNLSVWETPEHLRQFVYRSAHTEVLRERKSWFERFGDAYMAMWWIDAGHVPTVEEAKERLRHLQINGESEFAFSFAHLFTPTNADATAATIRLQPSAAQQE